MARKKNKGMKVGRDKKKGKTDSRDVPGFPAKKRKGKKGKKG
jgi:hypothetical protein